MKTRRQSKILELIQKNEVETQEELLNYLLKEGFAVTQATVSRDIREMKLTKVAISGNRQKYAVLNDSVENLSQKYIRVLRDGFISMNMAQNILVIKTVQGMAMAVAAAIDAMRFPEIVGCIAGDDTIMAAIRTVEDTLIIMKKLNEIIKG